MTVVGLPRRTPTRATTLRLRKTAPTNPCDTQRETNLVAMRPGAQQANTVMRQPGCARGCERQPGAFVPLRRPGTKPNAVKSAPAEATTANLRHTPTERKEALPPNARI